VFLQEKKTVTREEWEKAQPKPVATPGSASIDLRPNFAKWGLPLRKQGARDTCSVFASVGAMEYALARQLDRGVPLSVEFSNWAGDQVIRRAQDGHFFTSVIRGYQKFGVCAEEDMPYAPEFRAAYQPSEKALAAARELQTHKLAFRWLRPNDGTKGITDEHIAQCKAVLAQGWPIAAGSYHSILFVGFEDDPALEGGGQFLVRDSGGHNEKTLTYAAAKERMCDLFWVEPAAKPQS